MWDVAVVGGGPAGLIAARDIARAGYGVVVLEEHQEIGYPVKCSGLFSLSGLAALEIEPGAGVVRSVIKGGRFYSPAGKELLAYSDLARAVVVERKAFDKELGRAAARAGAEIRLKTSVLGLEVGEHVSVRTEGLYGLEVLEARLVVGADGMRSNVARRLGMKTTRRVVAAAQVEVEEAEVEEDIAEVYFGSRYAPGFYAWILPKGDLYEVGVGVRAGAGGGPREHLMRFMREHPIASKKVKGRSILELNLGGFPVDLPQDKTAGDRVVIVGDAAGHTKASTGGGVITGGIGARIAAKACVRALEAGDFSRAFLEREYEARWREEIGYELQAHVLLRRILDSLGDEGLEEVFQLAIDERLAEIMVRYRDTDRPSDFLREVSKRPKLMEALQKFLNLEGPLIP